MLTDTAELFADAIRAAGLTPPDSIEPGRFHRFPGQGKSNGNKAGWCRLFDDARGGIFGDFATGAVETWQAAQLRPPTLAERDAFLRNVEENKARAEAKRKAEHEQAGCVASERWAKAVPADAAHPYLTSKRIQPHGIKQDGDLLLIPVRDGAELHSLQTIAADGDKRFLPGGRVTGCYLSIGKPGDTVCIAEGYATAATIHEATGHPVAVAFNAGNLAAVAHTLRARLPGTRIIICADDDYRTAGNPGRTRAEETARAVGGFVALPDFGADRPDGATDFNDLAAHRGAEAVIQAVDDAHEPEVSEGQPSTENATALEPDGELLTIRRGDNIEPELIRWLWADWLARGKMHILAGAAGTGKTTLALAMAATITTGGRWPDGSRAEAADVLIWSGEDDPADTLVPRLLAMGADLRRMHFVGGVSDARGVRAFDPASDVRLLAQRFHACGDVALLIVDSIVSAVVADSHKNGEVRRGLQPLVDLAAAHGCALLGITHYSKGTSGRDPLERVTGSLAFGALPRVVMGTAKPTEAGEPRRLVRAKSNIGPDGGGFEYDLEQIELTDRPGLRASRVLWRSAIEGTARDLLAAVETDPQDDTERGATDEASAWLRDRLLGGSVPAGDIKREAERNGLAWRTVQRARIEIGAHSHREGFGKGSTVVWSLTLGTP